MRKQREKNGKTRKDEFSHSITYYHILTHNIVHEKSITARGTCTGSVPFAASSLQSRSIRQRSLDYIQIEMSAAAVSSLFGAARLDKP